ncbi:hypothetical protein [Streptomyces phaeoluteigriseus]
MPHVDPTHMAELALGNDASDNDVRALRHIAVCKRCREELTLMTRIVTAVRSVEESDLLASPPEQVWQRISQELAETDGATPPPQVMSRREIPPVARADSRHTTRSPGTRRRRTRLAYVLLTGILIVWWRSRRRSSPPSGTAADHPPVREDG